MDRIEISLDQGLLVRPSRLFDVVLGIVSGPGIQVLIRHDLVTVNPRINGNQRSTETYRKLSRHVGVIIDPFAGPGNVTLSLDVIPARVLKQVRILIPAETDILQGVLRLLTVGSGSLCGRRSRGRK